MTAITVEERLATLETEVRNLKLYISNDVMSKINSIDMKLYDMDEAIEHRFMNVLKIYLTSFTALLGLVGTMLWLVIVR